MEPVNLSEAQYEFTLLVSVMVADDVAYDCVLAMHPECHAEHFESGAGVDLLTVTALGRAMVRAAEAGLTQRESQSQARSSTKTQGDRRPH